MKYPAHLQNVVVKVLDPYHAKRVKKWFENQGVTDFNGLVFTNTENGGDTKCYYGVINNKFDFVVESTVKNNNLTVVEISDCSKYPSVMMVSNDSEKWSQRVVFMEKNGWYLAWPKLTSFHEASKEICTVTWKYAKPLKPELPKVQLTISQIAELAGVEPEQVQIVDDSIN